MEKVSTVAIINIAHIIVESSTFSESDNESDGLEELVAILKGQKTTVPRMQCKRYVEDVVSQYTDMDSKNNFRYILIIF